MDRTIIRLTVPTLGALVAPPLFVLADSAVVARLGAAPLAGLGIAATVLTTITALCIFLAYGTTAAVARLVGAGQRREALHQGVDGVWLAVMLGTALAVVGVLAAQPVCAAFGAAADVTQYATTYLRISSLGLPALLVSLAATGVLRGLQDVRTPLVVSVTAAAINLPLNVVLVLVLDLGVAGSAWGTVVVEVAAACAFVVVMARGVRREGASARPDRDGIARSARAATPLVVRVVAIRVVTIVALLVAASLSTDDLAAYHLAFTLYGLLSLALDALAIAGQSIVGQGLGAGDASAVRAATRRLTRWGWGAGLVLAAAVIALRSVYVPWLTPGAGVQDALIGSLVMVGLLQVVAGPVFVLDGVLLGAGDFRWLAIQQLVAMVIGVVALAIVAFSTTTLTTVWAALTVWMVARLVQLAWRSRTDTWMRLGAA
jgi:putative MATE family efflux protein